MPAEPPDTPPGEIPSAEEQEELKSVVQRSSIGVRSLYRPRQQHSCNRRGKIVPFVKDLKYVQIPGGHEIHMVQPERYIEELYQFIDDLRVQNKPP